MSTKKITAIIESAVPMTFPIMVGTSCAYGLPAPSPAAFAVSSSPYPASAAERGVNTSPRRKSGNKSFLSEDIGKIRKFELDLRLLRTVLFQRQRV